MKLPCSDDLRFRALAKANGGWEIHEVSAYSMWYLDACERGDAEKAAWWEAPLRMFVDTPLRWKEALSAASAQRMSPGAKLFYRTRKRLGSNRPFSECERQALRKLGNKDTTK